MPARRLLVFSLLSALTLAASDAPGVSNFHQVNDHVYRGAQPGRPGFESLAKLGVRTVIDRRGGHGRARAERAIAEAAGMRYVNVPLSGVAGPLDQQLSRVLGLLDDSSAWPVFIHCRRGKDRTGTVIACYRIAHDRWPNRKALEEAGSCGISRFASGMRRYILAYGLARRNPPQWGAQSISTPP